MDAAPEQVSGKVTGEGKEILASALASVITVGSRFPAQARSTQWPPSPTGEPAGAFWVIPPDEALEIGRAWAAVIAEFAPVEMIGGASVLVVAVLTTGMSVVPRVMTDMERSREWRAMQERIAAAETARADAAAAEAA